MIIKCFLGPADWATNCLDFCSKSAQSPIDFDPSKTKVVKDWLPLQLIHYEVEPYKMKITNDGHTAKVTFTPDDCTHIPTVIQGNLPGNELLNTFTQDRLTLTSF